MRDGCWLSVRVVKVRGELAAESHVALQAVVSSSDGGRISAGPVIQEHHCRPCTVHTSSATLLNQDLISS